MSYMLDTLQIDAGLYARYLILGLNNTIRLQDFVSKHQLKVFIIVGHQKAGKSSLLEAIMKLPLAYTASSLATKCPVKYVLTYDHAERYTIRTPSKEGDFWTECSAADVRTKLEDYMKKLGDRIDTKEILVTIQNSHVPNMVLIDLPGTTTNQLHKNVVLEILMRYLRHDQFIIQVAPCPLDPTGGIIDTLFLDGVVEDLKKQGININKRNKITVYTKLDLQVKNFKDQSLDQIFADIDESQRHFCTITRDGSSFDIKDFNAKSEMLLNIEDSETRFLTKELFHDGNRPITESTLLKIGLHNLISKLQAKFAEFFIKKIQVVSAKLQDLVDIQQNEKADLMEKLNAFTAGVGGKRDLFTVCVHQFVNRLNNVQTISDKDTSYVDRYGLNLDQIMKIGLSLGLGEQSKWGLLPSSELRKKIERDHSHIGASGAFFNILFQRFFGIPLYKQIRNIFHYMILERKLDENSTTNASIDSAALTNSKRLYDTLEAALKLARRHISTLKDAILWFKRLCYRTSELECEVTSQKLMKENSFAGSHWGTLLYKLSSLYKICIKNRLDEMQRRWNQSIELYSNYLPCDISVQSLMYALSCKLEHSLIMHVNQYKYSQIMEDFEEDDDMKMKRNIDPRMQNKPPSSQNVDPRLQKPPQGTPVQSTPIHNVQKPTPKSRFPTPRFSSPQPNVDQGFHPVSDPPQEVISRVEAKEQALRDIREQLRDEQQHFNTSDLVIGGYSTVPASTASAPFRLTIVHAANEYYMQALIRFLYDFDASFETYILSYLSEEHKSDVISDILERKEEDSIKSTIEAINSTKANLEKRIETLDNDSEQLIGLLYQISCLNLPANFDEEQQEEEEKPLQVIQEVKQPQSKELTPPAFFISPVKGLNRVQSPGSGHCLYFAASWYLVDDQTDETLKPDKLRKMVSKMLKKESKKAAELLKDELHGRSLNDYMKSLEDGIDWDVNVELNILMKIFDRPFIIIDNSGTLKNPEDADKYHGEPVFVFFNNNTSRFDRLILQPPYTSKNVLNTLIQDLVQRKATM